ncbi:hypothetical protein BH09ACT10_BH09ACT10_13540 [soil metagenome]
MSLTIHLLGRPQITRTAGETYQFRSRKSWAVLAYLVLSERPPSRSQIASLLFAEADDPARALRWSLAEIRRGLGDEGSVDGDPVALQLAADATVDVNVITHGTWSEAIRLPSLGADLLDGAAVRGAAAFETWQLSQHRHLAAASEAILHEAAIGSLSRDEIEAAIGYAVRATSMSPLDENHQALLIRLYRLAGDDVSATRQYHRCVELFDAELGTAPGSAVEAAMRESRRDPDEVADDATIEAVVEAGSAAVAAGAIEAGIHTLRTAARLADGAKSVELRVSSRLVLAEALVHSLGGLDEEGLATLTEADEIALAHGLHASVAQARAELGYVDFLRGRYDRSVVWLSDALRFADGSPPLVAKITTYLGSVASDRADYPRALTLLEDAAALSNSLGDLRRASYTHSMLGRFHFLRGDLGAAAASADLAIELAERDRWLAFVPWPQAIRAEILLARGDHDGASQVLEQAFARACLLGDPCWEGMTARGLALLAEASGQTERAFEILSDARARTNRLADPYVWLDAYILDAQCELGRRHDHPDTSHWVATMQRLTSRTGMKELSVRSLLHGAGLGSAGDAAAAVLLAADIDNPRLAALVTG